MDRTKDQLRSIGQEMFRENEVYKLVTFLNRSLKDRGFIFGLTLDKHTQAYQLTIYDTNLPPVKADEQAEVDEIE